MDFHSILTTSSLICSGPDLPSSSIPTFVLAPSDDYEELAEFCEGVIPDTRAIIGRHFLRIMNVLCPYCSAMHWNDERLASSSLINPLFGSCCLQGKIRLPSLRTPPPAIQSLYDNNDSMSKSFKTYIREYNASNAFTSLGANVDDRVLRGRGPFSFTIHGELRHRTGTLIPATDHVPSYCQLYIYDPSLALEYRCHRNPRLRVDVLDIIQTCLQQFNHFVPMYKTVHSILSESGVVSDDVRAHLRYTASTDRRRYNLPTSDEIAIILPGDGTELSGLRDIVLHLRGNHSLMHISECHPAYLPLHYVLLFPYGELGWEPELKQWDTILQRMSTTRLTQLQFYSYRLFERPSEYSTILRACKLFQEFIVDAWASTEQNRLTYYRINQSRLRAELYLGITDVSADDLGPGQIGQRMVLPSSFTGSPRNMFEILQDSLAITRYNHHPDIFLTMTANPKWPEITSSLLSGQTSYDRPDIVARVFELKRKALMKEIQSQKIFGTKLAHVFTIEFQKRGLPHMHTLLFLKGPDKIQTCAQVDKFVSSEIPDRDTDPALFDTISRCMIHGPCGVRNRNASCMENGICTKKYPRTWANSTTMDERGYPVYRRRNDGRSFSTRGHVIDNRDVVPYNPHLSRMFNCHINVEVCAGIRCVKYIHKYIYKGHDRTTMVLGGPNEIQQYLDSRYVGPTEAAWRIFSFPLHEELPSVVRLDLHLPGMHRVVYDPNETLATIRSRAANQMTTLTGFFLRCSSDDLAKTLTYQQFPEKFVWNKASKLWTPRQRGFSIGRLYFASPNSGERFYLRLLLTVVKGPTSFESLRTVNNTVCETFKDACVAMGLLEDDNEWFQCMADASIVKTGHQLRRLFCVILTECSLLHPKNLWDAFSVHICDDLSHKLQTLFAISDPTNAQITDYGLFVIDQLLNESGKGLSDFPPLPLPSRNWATSTLNRLQFEHAELQNSAIHSDIAVRVSSLNEDQHAAYSSICASVDDNLGRVFFLSGGAGTGKTFLYNTIATKVRSQGHIVITVASSGIASLLLVGGRTAHSTFRIPIDIVENSICSFTKQSIHADLFRSTKLIIWDEVPMQQRYCVESVDRSLQDTLDNNQPFGGITVVLGGDFRQILPVVPRGVREQIVGLSLRRSYIWNYIHVLHLGINMRLRDSHPVNDTFSFFLNEIGTRDIETVLIPPSIHRCHDMDELISRVYTGLDAPGTVTPSYLTDRIILSGRNDDVDSINAAALNIFPGESTTYWAADAMCDEDAVDRSITNRYPTEFMNSLNPPGLPPFKLELKIGSPIILLRNLAPKDGLCNGTRLMVVRCLPRVIEAMILGGDKSGNLVFIPRISLSPSSTELPFRMTRRQFPVRLTYAMTINKSQGQSVKYVGIDLRSPVFSHGHLYVAFSRCTSASNICVLLIDNASDTTINIVYPEVLL